MVVVLLAALLKGNILPLVVAVVVEDGDIVSEVPLQMPGQGTLSRTGSAGNANQHDAHAKSSQRFLKII